MSLTQVCLLFLVQMAFGSLVTFAVNDRQALGPKYFKLGGWIVVTLLGLAITLLGDASSGSGRLEQALSWSVWTAALAMLLFASLSGWDRPRLETVLLWLALAAGAVAVLASALQVDAATALGSTPHGGDGALRVASALGSSLGLGFTTWGMLLGHWYLVAPGLDIAHLRRLVTPLPWILAGQAVLAGIILWLLWERFLGPGNSELGRLLEHRPERLFDLVSVGVRLLVGLAIPAVLAVMTRVTVRMQKTQPATGILYAMCALVYLGDLVGKMVQASTGVPL